MDQLRRVLATIKAQLGRLGTTQKLLIGSLVVIVAMSLFVVALYAGRPALVPLWPGATAEEQQQALAFVQQAGYDHRVSDTGEVLVPASTQALVRGRMGQKGQLPGNLSEVMQNILKTPSWLNTKEANHKLYNEMLRAELAGWISNIEGIRDAVVFVDIPEPSGLGRPKSRPTASVTLFTQSGRALPQATVDMVARMIAGAVSGLEPTGVVVSEGNGTPRQVTDGSRLAPSTYLEYAATTEQRFKEKIQSLVAHIDPAAVVEVTAAVNISRSRTEELKYAPKDAGTISLPKRTTESTTTDAPGASGAEPGVRSNTGADINAGGAPRGGGKQTQEERESENFAGSRRDLIENPGGEPTSLVATVGIPREYIVSLIEKERPADAGAGAPADPAPPTPAEIDARFKVEQAAIEAMARPHLKTQTPEGNPVQGEVVVSLLSGSPVPGLGSGSGGAGRSGLAASGGIGGTVGTVLAVGGGLIDKAVLAALAVVALGMMLMMVRRAGRKADMPTAEELVGLPPALNTKSDLVGEADESETAIMGIEVGEEEIKADKLREQVSDLIKKSPDVAAKLLNRWVTVEE